jgi:DNA-binding GntR family transcriptional regulator
MTDVFRSTLADQAYASIKRKLSELDLMHGDRLAEKELAEQLGISRTPLRQALQRLHHEGLIDLLPRSGWAVPKLDFSRLDELYDFRVVIEQYAVNRCISEEACRSRLKPLKAIWCVPISERVTDPVHVGSLDEHFHSTLVAAAGNNEMIRAHAYITEHIRLIRRLDFIKPTRVNTTYDEHTEVMRWIFEKDIDQSQLTLRDHILSSKKQSREITLNAMFARRDRHEVTSQAN